MIPRNLLACGADRRLRLWEMQRLQEFLSGADPLGTVLKLTANGAPARSEVTTLRAGPTRDGIREVEPGAARSPNTCDTHS